MDSLRGQLLLAGPALFDTNFRRAVVLLGDHDEQGAIGVILNRPSETRVAEAVPALLGLPGLDEGPGELVYQGGPVMPFAGVVVADFIDPGAADLLAFGSIGFLLGESDPETAAATIRRARIFAGYAGWGEGQLEAELEQEGGWILEPAVPEDIFSTRPEHLWSDILRRKGSDYTMLRTMPFDPSAN